MKWSIGGIKGHLTNRAAKGSGTETVPSQGAPDGGTNSAASGTTAKSKTDIAFEKALATAKDFKNTRRGAEFLAKALRDATGDAYPVEIREHIDFMGVRALTATIGTPRPRVKGTDVAVATPQTDPGRNRFYLQLIVLEGGHAYSGVVDFAKQAHPEWKEWAGVYDTVGSLRMSAVGDEPYRTFPDNYLDAHTLAAETSKARAQEGTARQTARYFIPPDYYDKPAKREIISVQTIGGYNGRLWWVGKLEKPANLVDAFDSAFATVISRLTSAQSLRLHELWTSLRGDAGLDPNQRTHARDQRVIAAGGSKLIEHKK